MSFSFTAQIDRLIALCVLQARPTPSNASMTLSQVWFRHDNGERGDSVSYTVAEVSETSSQSHIERWWWLHICFRAVIGQLCRDSNKENSFFSSRTISVAFHANIWVTHCQLNVSNVHVFKGDCVYIQAHISETIILHKVESFTQLSAQRKAEILQCSLIWMNPYYSWTAALFSTSPGSARIPPFCQHLSPFHSVVIQGCMTPFNVFTKPTVHALGWYIDSWGPFWTFAFSAKRSLQQNWTEINTARVISSQSN